MAAVLKFVEAVSHDTFQVRKRVSKISAYKASPKAQSVGRRPNQKVGSFTNMSDQDRHELADMFEAELARL
tara:strand:- start:379 stop:591 length:213 start_codon:yes stop_codon:yes gene_type:complete